MFQRPARTPRHTPRPARSPGPPGEPPLAGEVFEKYHRYVAHIAFRILGRDAEVDDVVQDVFAAVIDRIDQLEDAASLHGWLAAVTVRRARDLLRWRRVRRVFGFDGDPPESALAIRGDAESTTEIRRLYRALDRVPAAARVAWVLRYIEGNSLEEVARLSGCSLATAKRRISAAQKIVQEVIGDG